MASVVPRLKTPDTEWRRRTEPVRNGQCHARKWNDAPCSGGEKVRIPRQRLPDERSFDVCDGWASVIPAAEGCDKAGHPTPSFRGRVAPYGQPRASRNQRGSRATEAMSHEKILPPAGMGRVVCPSGSQAKDRRLDPIGEHRPWIGIRHRPVEAHRQRQRTDSPPPGAHARRPAWRVRCRGVAIAGIPAGAGSPNFPRTEAGESQPLGSFVGNSGITARCFPRSRRGARVIVLASCTPSVGGPGHRDSLLGPLGSRPSP